MWNTWSLVGYVPEQLFIPFASSALLLKVLFNTDSFCACFINSPGFTKSLIMFAGFGSSALDDTSVSDEKDNMINQ